MADLGNRKRRSNRIVGTALVGLGALASTFGFSVGTASSETTQALDFAAVAPLDGALLFHSGRPRENTAVALKQPDRQSRFADLRTTTVPIARSDGRPVSIEIEIDEAGLTFSTGGKSAGEFRILWRRFVGFGTTDASKREDRRIQDAVMSGPIAGTHALVGGIVGSFIGRAIGEAISPRPLVVTYRAFDGDPLVSHLGHDTALNDAIAKAIWRERSDLARRGVLTAESVGVGLG